TSWSSWNVYAEELARRTGARAVRISDGGITGPAFFDHVRRSGRPIINCPKGQGAPLPPDLVRRPLVRAGDLLDLVPGVAPRRGAHHGPRRRRGPPRGRRPRDPRLGRLAARG